MEEGKGVETLRMHGDSVFVTRIELVILRIPCPSSASESESDFR
jgi:hypothetical protein